MLRKIELPTTNIDNSVEFILRGAKKRRSMAMASARMLTNEQGIQTMLVAVKQWIFGRAPCERSEPSPKGGARRYFRDNPNNPRQ